MPRSEVRRPPGALARERPERLERLLIVTPHSSGAVTQDVLAAMLGEARDDLQARERLLRRVFLQGDPYTDVIFDVDGAASFHAPLSRFVVDLNRPRDFGGPNGVVKLTDFDGEPLYAQGLAPTEADIEERLRRYWDPFHDDIERIIRQQGIALLIDGHSMTGTGPALGPDSGAKRPAVTLMTGGDEHGEAIADRAPSLPPALARECRRLAEVALGPLLESAAPDVEPVVVLNRPWSADELSYLHGPPNGVPAFGIEINRDLYLNEATGEPLPERIKSLRAGVSEFAAAALRATARGPQSIMHSKGRYERRS